jgi:hypothetical protein
MVRVPTWRLALLPQAYRGRLLSLHGTCLRGNDHSGIAARSGEDSFDARWPQHKGSTCIQSVVF